MNTFKVIGDRLWANWPNPNTQIIAGYPNLKEAVEAYESRPNYLMSEELKSVLKQGQVYELGKDFILQHEMDSPENNSIENEWVYCSLEEYSKRGTMRRRIIAIPLTSHVYSDKIHHGEVKVGAKFNENNSTSEQQDLAGKKGIDGAKKIMTQTKQEFVNVKVEYPEHDKIVLTNPNGDTYTSKSESLIDFFHAPPIAIPLPEVKGEDKQLTELEQLRAWKREAIEVMPDFQEIGKLLKIPLGQSVHDKIIPAIKKILDNTDSTGWIDVKDKIEELAKMNAEKYKGCIGYEYDASLEGFKNGASLCIESVELLKKYEQWEADILAEDRLWWPNRASDVLRGKLYDTMLELQKKRNAILHPAPPQSSSTLTK